jgi:aryl-alcohol dehydrogenase-like predicted oxidoreductase
MIERRFLGRSGMAVSSLGVGAGRIGDPRVSDNEVEGLISRAIDLGVCFFDTARSYGVSEERLGRHLGPRRRDVVLATKAGYGIDGLPDWTGDTLRAGIERALRMLRTDWIDVLFLHSCPGEVASREDILRALSDAKAAGSIRAAGYSGENEDLDRAVSTGAFDVVQLSVNPWDQGSVHLRTEAFAANGIGVVAKRPLAAAPWLGCDKGAPDEREYRRRFDLLGIDLGGMDWAEASIRFAAHARGVASALAGTTSFARLETLAAAVSRGPLPDSAASIISSAWARAGGGMRGVI